MAAKRMIGRTPSYIQAIRPLRDGVIADFDVTEKMLRYFIDKVHTGRFAARPRIVICVPSGITATSRTTSPGSLPSTTRTTPTPPRGPTTCPPTSALR